MPKAILEFNLPEDQEAFDQATKAGNYALMLWGLDQTYLRAAVKYGSIPMEVAQELREEYTDDAPSFNSEEEKNRFICTVLSGVRTLLHSLAEEHDIRIL